jgi:hypothetical protein
MITQESRLLSNDYPGRGIVLGLAPDGRHAVQVYWAMGRSENSKKRVFVREGDVVKTLPTGDAALNKPELIIYNMSMQWAGTHVITNGRQTDDIASGMQKGLTLEQSLAPWLYEDDGPIYTPRISGVSTVENGKLRYQLAILKTADNDPAACLRQFFAYDAATPGIGHCIHTYAANANPCPPFSGEPFPVALQNDPEETLAHFWDMLSPAFRVGLFVKFIDVASGEHQILLRNAQEA